MYDLIIIGGGPAALTAGIYGARKKLNILIFFDKPSWQLTSASNIENYPGLKSISGNDLFKKMKEQLDTYELEEKNEAVRKIEIEGENNFKVFAGSGEYRAKAVIVASGKFPKHLNVPGEEEFTGKGVSYCVTCDGPLFSKKDVAVIGGGNAGLGAVFELSKYANKIYLLGNSNRLFGEEVGQEKIKQLENVEVILNAEIKEIKGGNFVSGLVYKDKKTGETKELKVEGVFVEIGSVPAADFVEDLVEFNELGEIIIDSKTNMTKTAGLFSAGDVTDVKYKQIIIACGEGAKAALSAYEYLSKNI